MPTKGTKQLTASLPEWGTNMALDPNIILGIRPPDVQPYDASRSMAQGLTLANLLQQNKAGQFDQQLKQRALDDDTAMRDIARGAGGNLETIRDNLMGQGYYKQAQEVDKQIRETQTSKLDQATKVGTLMKDSATAILANPSLDFAMGELDRFEQVTGIKQDGQRKLMMQIGNNPEGIRKLAAGYALKASELLPKTQNADMGGYVSNQVVDQLTGKVTETGRTNKTLTAESILTDERTRSEGAKNRGVTVRGQNMTDSRQREMNEFNKRQGKEKITDTQRANSGYLSRMEAAENLLTSNKDQKPGIIETVARGAPIVGNEISANLARGEGRQKALQAQRDWVRAKLRKESGAVIGPQEMLDEISTYFPQIGDSDGVIEQKKQARLQAAEAMKTSSGASITPVLNSGATGGWSIEEVK
jgi:hypothetical protein